jgi:hypothetical protein
MRQSLLNLKKIPISDVAQLRQGNVGNAKAFAEQLMSEAKAVGLNMKDYLVMKLDVSAAPADQAAKFSDGKGGLLNGYHAALRELDLPLRNDYENGVTLQAASNTFQTFPGTRILFPQVVDDTVNWAYRQTNFERLEGLVGNSRTIDGTEVLSMVVDDAATDYQFSARLTEKGQVPIHSVTASEKTVKIYKFGLGWEFTYEFERRASVDLIVPFATRSKMQIERSKVWEATGVLINGDGAYGAAPEVNQSDYDVSLGIVSVPGKISYKHLVKWLVERAKAGTPVDTVVGDFDAYLQWLFLFAIPTSNNTETDAQTMARAGFQIGGVPILSGTVNFVLSSAVPANKLIGITKAITLEELVENGSKIEESERSIRNQKVTFVSTENSGFKLTFGDTRSVFDFGN